MMTLKEEVRNIMNLKERNIMKEGSIADIREKINNLKNFVKKLYDELNFLRELDQVNDNELI